jgi:hypothetical protein
LMPSELAADIPPFKAFKGRGQTKRSLAL